MQFNQEEAVKAGLTGIDTGAHIGKIECKKTIAGTGTQGLEFSIETESGAKAQYLTVYYKKADGSIIKMGQNIIQAVMGLLKIREIKIEDLQHDAVVVELSGKSVGLVLQKVHYSKTTGGDGYKFEVKFPFSATSGKTFKEALEQKEAVTVKAYCEKLQDKDEREAAGSRSTMSNFGQQTNQGQPVDLNDDWDDIQF